jgi:hypothetical protein
MKLSLLFIISLLFCSRSISQVQYFVEYNFLVKNKFVDLNNPVHAIVSNNISFGIEKNKTLYSLALGREDWFLNHFDNKNTIEPQMFTYYCRTHKLTPMIERQFIIPKSNFSFRLGGGCKFFILNQMNDSLSYAEYRNYFFSVLKPNVISKFNPNSFSNIVNGYDYGSLSEHYYITNVPYALTANFAIQYSFKKWAIKLQYEPTLMRVKTRNAANSNVKSSVFFFYNNIGLGINYPLNFKKKEKTSPINQ